MTAAPSAPELLAELRDRLATLPGPAGRVPSSAVQLVYVALRRFPEHVARHPGSRGFRAALGSVTERAPLPCRLSRKEIDSAIGWLGSRGLLPGHVVWHGPARSPLPRGREADG